MCDVLIQKNDNIYAKITCEPSIAQELHDFFTFTVPGHQFSPAFRKKHWDGRAHLYNLRTNQIYLGLVKYIKEFCKMNNYSYEYLDQEEVFLIDTKNLVKSLILPENIQPRDYQLIASSYGLSHKRTVLISPTASGKSLIIYIMLRHLLQTKQRGLLIVPTVNLVAQMYSDFEHYSSVNGWDVEKHCQKIYAGETKIPEKDLVISTWQSIYELNKKYFTQFDFIIGDESHTFKSTSLVSIMTKLTNCDVRIGTTGTLDDSKVNKLVLEGLFGPVQRVISTKELIDRSQLADFSVKFLILKYPDQICELVKGMSYQEEIDFIVRYEPRNNFITNLTISLKGNTLILFTFVEKHGIILKQLIEEKANGRKVFFIHGGVDVDEREAVRAITEKETDAIIVASYGTMSTGTNIKNLHNVIFASPTKSKIRSLQSIGRVLRLGDNKKEAVLYDIADDLRSSDHINFALKHYEERVKIYSEEKFSFTTTNIIIHTHGFLVGRF